MGVALEKSENLRHWENWANEYGGELRATTKCLSIKRLEIEALIRRISATKKPNPLVVEIGSGNGANGFALVSRSPTLLYLGLDFSPTMVRNAIAVAQRRQSSVPDQVSRVAFGVADARELKFPLQVDRSQPTYAGEVIERALTAPAPDIVFTDRMLINLASADEQLEVMRRIDNILAPGGLFLMIENSVQTHARLNYVRAVLGLSSRPPADYNVFIDEPRVISVFEDVMQLVAIDDFGAVHDLLLYAVGPSLGHGDVEYDSPLMTRLTDALIALGETASRTGGFGQNRLWVWQKR
jgi:SAM-dependent methyltransferase